MSNATRPVLTIEKVVKGKVEGFEQWDSIPLNKDVTCIGRSGNQRGEHQPDIRLLGDDYISRNHAEITYSSADGCFMLMDKGSKCGTILNGEMLESKKPYPLKDQDQIELARVSGVSRFVFKFKVSDGTMGPGETDEPAKSVPGKGWCLIHDARKAYLNGQVIALSKKEFAVLEVLYNNKGKPCEIDTIAWEVWGKEVAGDELVSQYIRILRKKVEPDPSTPRYIKTVLGGYSCYKLVD
jgi:hypothetical protein